MDRGNDTGFVRKWLAHIKVLAGDIGARLPATGGEARAADYCRATLEGLGLTPEVEEFPSAGSVFRPHLVAALILLAAFFVYPIAPPASRWVAFTLTLLAVGSEVMEITLRPNPLQWVLTKRISRNVFCVIEPAAGEPARDIVIMGHIDSQRTPVIFSTDAWLRAYRAFSTAAFVAFLAQVFLYAGGVFLGWTWAWPLSSVGATSALLLALLTLQAEATPSSPGANDNATAAGLVLALAEELAADRPGNSRVWCVCSGSEESLHEGAKTFFARHTGEMNDPRAIVFEMLGCSGPAWLLKEGFVLLLRSSPELQRVAEKVAQENPDFGAYPISLSGGVTEMSDALLAGVPAITVIGVTPRGEAPHWHRPSDTVDKMDPEVMERNYRFVRAMLAELD